MLLQVINNYISLKYQTDKTSNAQIPGDEVSAGDVIFEMETDKATMEVESPDDGVIAKIIVPAGSGKTPVNALVAVMVEPGEDIGSVEIPAHDGMSQIRPRNLTLESFVRDDGRKTVSITLDVKKINI